MKFPEQYNQVLNPVYAFAKKRKKKLYLVGGILRDLFIGRKKENLDFDFALKRGAIGFGRALAKELRAGFVVLDEEHGACRVVKKTGNGFYTLDFTDFRGSDLEKDLLHRDFTINAIAYDPDSDAIIDPYGGREDLKKKVIRAVNKGSFAEDPLRVLRAFSFATILSFKIDGSTLRLAKTERKNLTKVSFERVRDELFKIFSQNNTYDCLLMLDELKILEVIFPEIKKMRGIGQGPYHHLDVWQHTLETVKQIETVFKDKLSSPDIKSYLYDNISGDRKRFALIKFGAFIHDVGKPAALRREGKKIIFHGHEHIGRRMSEDIARRLKLSNDEVAMLKRMVQMHLRPGYLADNQPPTERAKFRYFRDGGSEAVAVLLVSLADQRATKGPLTTAASRVNHEKLVAAFLKDYFKKKKEKKAVRLIDGHILIKELKLKPSPLIGKLLAELEELQAIGKIKTRDQALKAAREFVKGLQKK
jgi:tRNA nucleotidyltransferase/poly(A) polymerase